MFIHYQFLSKFCPNRKGNEDRVYCKPLDSVPVSDQHVALGILLELGVQRGTLQHMLEVILLLLELWDSGQDNDTDSCFTSAPLIHLLRRFEEITGASHKTLEPNKLAEEVNVYHQHASSHCLIICAQACDNNVFGASFLWVSSPIFN